MGGGTIARSAIGDTVTITGSSIAVIFRGIFTMTAAIMMTAMPTGVIVDTAAGKEAAGKA